MSRFDLISIIVPALNESASMEELYERTRRALGGGQPFEFIVVDDGSTDETVDTLKTMRERCPNICILSHYRNHGKSLALMQGFAAARGDVAVIMDADLQDQPEAIPQFLDKIAEGYDLVNGWRKDRRDARSKVLVSGVFNLLTSRIFKCRIHDINCGFKAIRRPVYKQLELQGDLHRLIPAIVAGKGGKVTEIPVPHCPRKYGQSRYRLLRHRGLLDIIALVAGNATQLRPFHVFCEAAIAFWVVAAAALAGWVGLTIWGVDEALWMRLLRPLVAMLGAGSVFVGTILPLFGFQMEVTSGRHQDAGWRRALLKERIEARVGGYEPRRYPEAVASGRGLEAVLEPKGEPLSAVERVPVG
jgi:glycosyltransferase involved in cell wall biosynthesis